MEQENNNISSFLNMGHYQSRPLMHIRICSIISFDIDMCSLVNWSKNNVAEVVARKTTWLDDTKSSWLFPQEETKSHS
jgi:hypothetical protein